MKYTFDICSECKNKRLIVNKTHVLCADCNRIRLDKQSSHRAIKRTKMINKLSKSRGERLKAQAEADEAFYRDIWDRRVRKCVFCDAPLGGVLKNYYVHHVFPKAKFPELRYVNDNAVLVDFDCHQRVEAKDYTDRMVDVIIKTGKKLIKKKLLTEIGSPNVYRIKDWITVYCPTK